jgi:hypothetical protein
MQMRRAEVTDGAATRSSAPFPEEAADRIHSALQGVAVELPAKATTERLRDVLRLVRRKRNAVAATIGGLRKIVGRLKADAERIDRIYQAERALRRDRADCYAGTTNDKQREARLDSILSVELDAASAIAQDLARASEALAHSNLVMDELRGVFDEASRMLATVELDERISRGS